MSSHTQSRIVHDADSHLTKPRGWLERYASQSARDNLETTRPKDLAVIRSVTLNAVWMPSTRWRRS